MNTIIKIGLGIALALPLSTSIPAVNNAYSVETSLSFRTLSKISSKELVAHSPMNGEQLAATKGMAGICISCLVQTLGQHGKFSVDDMEATVIQLNQFVGAGPVNQSTQAMVDQTMINQAFSPSRQQLTVLTTNLAQEIRTSTQEIIDQNLSQLQNVLQPGQSPIGSGERLAREIHISTQEIINQALMNGTVITMTNQSFPNIPSGGFLR